MKKALATLAVLSVGIIAGCGSSTTQAATVSGTVADGYLQNAMVFLDKNFNYQLDQGEPSATTGQNGAYTLNVAPEDIGKYPVVAMAITGQTIDSDTGVAVSSSYVLCTPGAAVSGTVENFIRPMSTLIREKLEANPGMTLTEAMAQLRSQLNMPGGMNVLGNYMAGSMTGGPYQAQYLEMHRVAQQTAGLMGEQAGQVMNGTTGAYSSRFRGMMGQLDQYLPQVSYNVYMGSGMDSEFMNALRNQMQIYFTSLSFRLCQLFCHV